MWITLFVRKLLKLLCSKKFVYQHVEQLCVPGS